jgi:hypothetical protein
MRVIQAKQQETIFITVNELMRLQKAGFDRPRNVPPKPMPKGQGHLEGTHSTKSLRGRNEISYCKVS